NSATAGRPWPTQPERTVTARSIDVATLSWSLPAEGTPGAEGGGRAGGHRPALGEQPAVKTAYRTFRTKPRAAQRRDDIIAAEAGSTNGAQQTARTISHLVASLITLTVTSRHRIQLDNSPVCQTGLCAL